jgi:hypothetical protein
VQGTPAEAMEGNAPTVAVQLSDRFQQAWLGSILRAQPAQRFLGLSELSVRIDTDNAIRRFAKGANRLPPGTTPAVRRPSGKDGLGDGVANNLILARITGRLRLGYAWQEECKRNCHRPRTRTALQDPHRWPPIGRGRHYSAQQLHGYRGVHFTTGKIDAMLKRGATRTA